MNFIRITHRLLSIGNTTGIIFKSNNILTRWFHPSIISLNGNNISEKINTNKEISELLKKTSISPTINSNTPTNKRHEIWKRMIHELKHYYNGSKLLCTETKITFGLLQQVLNGHRLTRRERKQLTRTINDLFRVVPFSVFIIVPFMEFTLPIFLKLFPNMLPSTFKQINNNEENLKKFFQIKLEATQFLQDTIFKSQDISFNDMITIQFEEFLQKIHTSDNYPTINEIVEFSSRFSHKLTIDNLDRSQLTALCKLFNLSFNGPKHYLRYKLRLKLYRLKNDDKLILNEGITNLNIEELQAACHERGINSFDINNKSLQSQLQQWLDLHSDKSISPITILLILHKIKTKDTTVSQPIYVNNDMKECQVFSQIQSTKIHTKQFTYLQQISQTSSQRQEIH